MIAPGLVRPGQGAGEHVSECTPTRVSECAQTATPAWATRFGA